MTALVQSSLGASAPASLARGACPALSAPMLTGDGYLARLALTDAVTPWQLLSICALSQRYGNGILDITARGNLQFRGLTEASARQLEEDVRALGLPLREGLAVEWSPLAGEDAAEIADPGPIGHAIIARAAGLQDALAPKMSVIIDAGGRIGLDHLLADIRLQAVAADDGGLWQLTLGGTARSGLAVGKLQQEDAANVVLSLLEHLASLGATSRGRDLLPEALPAWVRARMKPAAEIAPRLPAPFGAFDLRTGAAVRIAVAFGQCSAERLHALAEQALRLGIMRLRPAADHALIGFGPQEACAEFVDKAREAGFITRIGDPLAQIDACPGAPSCRSGCYATHETGRAAAKDAAALLDGSVRLHLSGCIKGCAHPGSATIALVGTAGGTHLVFNGKTTDTPLRILADGSEPAALAALATLTQTERRPAETSRDCLARLGPTRIAAALSESIR